MSLCIAHGNPAHACIDCRLASTNGVRRLQGYRRVLASRDSKNQAAIDLLISEIEKAAPSLKNVDLQKLLSEQELMQLAQALRVVFDDPAAPANSSPVDEPPIAPTSASGRVAPPPDLVAAVRGQSDPNPNRTGRPTGDLYRERPRDMPVRDRAPGAPAPKLAPGSEEMRREYGQVPALTPDQLAEAVRLFNTTGQSLADAIVAVRTVRNNNNTEGS
jgi:hypothetical protein